MKFYILIFMASMFPLLLQAQFLIEAEVRPRLEIRDGYSRLAEADDSPAILVSQRSRLGIAYNAGNFNIKINPQHVYIWGDKPVMNASGISNSPSLDLYEGYVELALGDYAWLKAGRQVLDYDSKRLLGNRNWNQNGLSYDALTARLKLQQINLHIGATWNNLNESISNNYYPEQRIKNLNFIWLNRSFQKLNLSLLHISSGKTISDTSNTMRYKNTSGIYFRFNGGRYNLWAHGYYQWGKSEAGKNVNALLTEADISVKTGMVTLGGGISYMSGNSQHSSSQSSDHRFDLLYGNRHSYSGEMDYFTNPYKNTEDQGFIGGYLYASFRASDKLNIANTVHYFAQADKVGSKRNLGIENDLIIKYKVYPQAQLQAGYCVFKPSQTLKQIQNKLNTGLNQFFYLQLTVSAEIFQHTRAGNED